MITLKTLQWDNCFSYGKDNTLHVNDSNLTQLVGTNGQGKSSIPLIIEEVLFNKNSKGIKKQEIQNRFINQGYHINLTFTVDANNYEIDVIRKAGIKCKLYENGKIRAPINLSGNNEDQLIKIFKKCSRFFSLFV